MSFFSRFSKKFTAPTSSRDISNNPFLQSRTTPTRRPQSDMEQPPSYIESIRPDTKGATTSTGDSRYEFLSQFDTIFLIDDSGSMCGRSWRETSAALSAITPVCTQYDADGIDIFFLNHRNRRTNSGLAPGGYTNVNTPTAVQDIFNTVRPCGGTPTGTRLNQILKPYLSNLEADMRRSHGSGQTTIKPLNIIVITDGVPSDDVESVIVSAARKLDKLEAEPWQIGIQFFQVGNEYEAEADLKALDDALSQEHKIRDMVDTAPWSGNNGRGLDADGILKVVLGSVNRRLDRRAA